MANTGLPWPCHTCADYAYEMQLAGNEISRTGKINVRFQKLDIKK